MRAARLLLCFLLFTTPAFTQDLGILEEPSAGNFFGIGARQMSMGGSGIANSLDGAALFYNPSALARIPRIEFQIEMTHQKFSNETTMPPNRYDAATFQSTISSAKTDASKNRLSAISLSVPIPTYRGALVVAFGVRRVMNFDRVSAFKIFDIDNINDRVVDFETHETENGSIYLYIAAGAIDVSPKISVGLALNAYSGKDNFRYSYYERNDITDSIYDITNNATDDYFGMSLKTGMSYRPNNRLTLGMAFETPTYWEIKQTFIDGDYREVTKYHLIHPFKIGAGASYRKHMITITGEAEYVGWSHMKYGGNADMEVYNDSLSQLYRDVFNLRFGAEYEFPKPGLAFRAGVFSQPLPYDGTFIKDDRMGYSVGFGWLMNKVLMIEGAFVHGGMKRTYTAVNAEYTVANNKMAMAKDRYSRFYLTISYRY